MYCSVLRRHDVNEAIKMPSYVNKFVFCFAEIYVLRIDCALGFDL